MTTNSQKTREMTPEENFRELYKRFAQLNDKVSALLAPAWGSEMGLIPSDHPLYQGEKPVQEQEQGGSVDWRAIVERRERQLKTVGGARHAAEQRADRAEAALDRVRALHQPQHDGSGFPDSQQCSTCSQDGGDGYQYLVPWPCPTIRAIDQPKEQRERPTHPDGTPYRYHEITAEGWEHCDGCGLWGQWTVTNPHECANDRVQPADQPKEQ
ncbi:hypothetical protein ACWGNR_10120 [Streptomyces althioticus]